MIRHTATGHVLEGRVRIELRIELPLLFTGRGIQSKQLLVRRTQVKHVADFDWRHFVSDFARIVRGLQVTGTESPGHVELADVFIVDLVQWRVTGTALSTAIGRPVTGRNAGIGCRRCSIGSFKGAVDFLRIVEDGVRQHNHGEQQGNGQSAACESVFRQHLVIHNRQQDPQAQEEGDV
ncbi:hypothetical protein SRABI106_02191 [Rahnella aquatilis]|nr:hypothetical protein SRABI106_02191 [Rahnella aquatilis]